MSDKLFHVLFADDTNVFLNGKNMNMLIDTIQQELSILYVWLLANKLSLNLSKTHFMVFYKTRHKQYKIHIEINKVSIEQVKHTKFVGVIFDDRLEWSNHIHIQSLVKLQNKIVRIITFSYHTTIIII